MCWSQTVFPHVGYCAVETAVFRVQSLDSTCSLTTLMVSNNKDRFSPSCAWLGISRCKGTALLSENIFRNCADLQLVNKRFRLSSRSCVIIASNERRMAGYKQGDLQSIKQAALRNVDVDLRNYVPLS